MCLIKPFLGKFKEMKHKKKEIHVNITQSAMFGWDDSYEMKFVLHFSAKIWLYIGDSQLTEANRYITLYAW